MRRSGGPAALLLPLAWIVSAHAAGPAKIVTYPVEGASGIELYRSIGANGPKGVIAETRYKLSWKRLFDEEGGDCRLVRFEPALSISVVLPKPKKPLADPLRQRWETFIAGVRKHEDVHVEMIGRMVEATRKAAAGAEVKNDRTCAKVKKLVSRIISEHVEGYKAASGEFDRREMSDGGNVHQLVLALVN